LGIFLLVGFGCQATNTKAITDDHAMELIVEPGEQWLGRMWVFIFPVDKTPQMAAWIEDGNGRYVQTVTVTNRSGKATWRSAPKEGRPEALPVWNHRHGDSQADIDTVSAATQKHSVEARVDSGALVDGNTYNVYLEINQSYDYNDHWTKDNSGVNGQPSLVYHAQFAAGQPGRIALVPIGHGSVDGSNGNINGELESFTSALKIVQNVYVENRGG